MPERLAVGALTVIPIIDAYAQIDPVAVYGAIANELGGRGLSALDWQQHPQFLDAAGRVTMPVGAFLVRSGERVLLLDAGFGPDPGLPIDGGHLVEGLATVGVTPGDVTDVVFSHCHPDHVGWASVDGTPTFPNATYRCHRADWDYFALADNEPRSHRVLRPIAGRVEVFDADTTIAPGVDSLAAPGHTPGNTYIVLSSGSDRVLVLGDIVHCPVELLDDEWASLADLDPRLARATRERLARELEGDGSLVSAPHFPGLQFGRVVMTEGRRRWIV